MDRAKPAYHIFHLLLLMMLWNTLPWLLQVLRASLHPDNVTHADIVKAENEFKVLEGIYDSPSLLRDMCEKYVGVAFAMLVVLGFLLRLFTLLVLAYKVIFKKQNWAFLLLDWKWCQWSGLLSFAIQLQFFSTNKIVFNTSIYGLSDSTLTVPFRVLSVFSGVPGQEYEHFTLVTSYSCLAVMSRVRLSTDVYL